MDKRILWVDGCFDMFHYGHANAMRQVKELFPKSKLYVGVHTDEEIMINKGITVMKEKERYEAVRSCRWVDKVIEGAPYTTSLKILNNHNVDYCVHGEDISLDANGNNTYQELIDAGKFLTIKRTRGVSTTNIVNRLLNATAQNPEKQKRKYSLTQRQNLIFPDEERTFFPSALRISQFSRDLAPPKEKDTIVYVDGTFDLFHVGHVEFLKKAKELGDYLIVGIHDDETIKYYKGDGFPILSLHERVLGCLSCRHVDDVIIGAPFCVTDQMIQSYNIKKVVVGSMFDNPNIAERKDIDPYKVPKDLNIFCEIKSPTSLSLSVIVNRIIQNSNDYTKRQEKRKNEKTIFEEIEKKQE